MKTLWLTGGTGFVGRQVLASLARCDDFDRVLVTSKSGQRVACTPSISYHALDLLDQAAVFNFIDEHRPDYLLHLAWEVTHGHFWTAADNLNWTAATLILSRRFWEAGGTRMVGVGTCAEYSWPPERPLSEKNSPEQPTTLYGTAKLATKNVLEAYATQNDVSFAWARLFFLFGPGEPQRRLVADTMISLLEERPLLCSDGKQLRDFMAVADVADALLAVLRSDVTGVVNIGSREPLTIEDLVRRIDLIIGGSGDITFGARPRAANDPDTIVPDLSRLTDEIGWTSEVNLDTRLAETIAWWRNELSTP